MTRPERKRPPRPARSDRERPDLKLVVPGAKSVLTSQSERFTVIARELPPLFERHWRELGDPRVPLDPDWDRYFALEVAGSLRMTTARLDGTLAGYISNIVGPHLHYRSTLHAEIEMFYLESAYRGSWFVLQWFRANDLMLHELGVKRVSVAVKSGYRDGRVGSIFRRLGYKTHETVWMRSF